MCKDLLFMQDELFSSSVFQHNLQIGIPIPAGTGLMLLGFISDLGLKLLDE